MSFTFLTQFKENKYNFIELNIIIFSDYLIFFKFNTFKCVL